MKKLLYSLAFLASLLSIFSCERENKPGEPTDGKLVVSAVISDWTSAKVLPEGTAGEWCEPQKLDDLLLIITLVKSSVLHRTFSV